MKQIRFSEFEGKTVAIDASMWLYRGAHSDKNNFKNEPHTPDSKYIDFVIRKIDQLLKENVELILVFDEPRLPKYSGDNIHITPYATYVFIQVLIKKKYENVEFIIVRPMHNLHIWLIIK
ncbi:unnamed protein product, partial [Arabidopsis halleri]